MKLKHKFPFHVVVYWDDIETEAHRARIRSDILEAGADAACFYTIREHEISCRLEKPERTRRIVKMAGFAKELGSHGIEAAAALLPSLGWGQVKEEGPFQKITGPDGTRSGAGCCPLDADLRAHLKDYMHDLVGHGFKTIHLEDDYQNDNHRPVREGCFCPLHLAEFSKREGKSFARDALVESLGQDPLLKARWMKFKIDVLVDLADELITGARLIEPSTRLVLLGGVNLRDLVARIDWKEWRPPQGCYQETPFTPVVGAWHGHAQGLSVDSTKRPPLLAEITGWPRNAFAKSWDTMAIQTALSAFLGFDAALFWAGIGHRDPGFAEFGKTHRAWFDFVSRAAEEHPRRIGLVTPVNPNQFAPNPAMLSLARMGFALNLIPSGAVDSRSTVALLSSTSIPDGLWESGRPAIIDLETIRNCRDAFASHLSLEPSECMFSSERISDDPLNGASAGLYSTSLTLLKEDGMHILKTTRPLRILSHYVDCRSQTITPCMAIDEAQRWLIVNTSPVAWDRLISWFKAEQFRNAIEHVHGGPLPAALLGGTDTFVFARESEGHRVVFVVNLSMDGSGPLQLKMDRGVSNSWQATGKGEWQPLSPEACPARGFLSVLPPRSMRLYRFDMS